MIDTTVERRRVASRATFAGWVLGGVAALAAVVEFVSAVTAFPVPRTDTAAFLPAAIEFRQHGALTNSLYAIAREIDTTGQSRFLFHGPLFPSLIGLVMPGPGVVAALVVIAAINTATIVGFAIAAHHIVRRLPAGRDRLAAVAAAVVMVVALTGMNLPTVGRPESLSALLGLAVLAATRLASRPVRLTAIAVLVGLVGATQPAGAALLGVAIVAWLAAREPARGAAAASLLVIVGAIATTTALLAASPNGLTASVRGIVAHAGYLARRAPSGLADTVRYSFFW